MRFLVEIPGADEGAMLRSAAVLIRLVAAVNYRAARRGALPALYSTRIRYRAEPPGPEMIDHGGIVLGRGWGDCDDLVAYRLGELWHGGERGASPRIVWRRGTKRYHAQVRRADGSIEDPCRVMVNREKAGK